MFLFQKVNYIYCCHLKKNDKVPNSFTGCEKVRVGYFVLDPYVIPDHFPLDGADIRVWKIAASKLNLCANFTGGKDPTNAFSLVQYNKFVTEI